MKTKQLETKTGGWILWLRDEMVETGGREMRERNMESVETDLVNTKLLETKTGGRILLRDEIVETVLIGERNILWLRDEMVETVLIGFVAHTKWKVEIS
ncbi:hypothetical protein BY996DRAFT_6532728 [Phakopsora pachyrhizi]|nr:hypothetical protein BY996DRAFT_6532728 [Phakopsora pachyrhizi]